MEESPKCQLEVSGWVVMKYWNLEPEVSKNVESLVNVIDCW